jgi:serine protease Do
MRIRMLSSPVTRLFWTALAVSCICTTLSSAARADYKEAKRHFELLSVDDRLEIMLGLIGTGDFIGLIDFGFTKRFYNSIVSFERRRSLVPDGILTPREIRVLKQDAGPFYANIGTEWVDHPFAGSRLFLPLALFDHRKTTREGFDYERDDGNLSLSFIAFPQDDKSFTKLYERMSSPSPRREVTYKRLRNDYFVVSGTYRGRQFYTWMSSVPGGSTGFTLAWSNKWDSMGSRLSILLANTFLPIADRPVQAPKEMFPAEPRSDATASQTPELSPPQSGTGTGFRVTDEDHVLTNYHVAGNCKEISLRRPGELAVKAELVAGDQQNDLALLKAASSLGGTVARFRSGPSAKAGAEIVVYGFPLSDILASSGNIVTGNITSLAGIGNDSSQYQISTPVQPGNSGGPVLDRAGRIVAVVVSKLDAIKAAARSGDIPQNVNFAIKSSVAANFLDGASIAYQMEAQETEMDTPTLAELAQGFTYLVECIN